MIMVKKGESFEKKGEPMEDSLSYPRWGVKLGKI